LTGFGGKEGKGLQARGRRAGATRSGGVDLVNEEKDRTIADRKMLRLPRKNAPSAKTGAEVRVSGCDANSGR
jgi:hypothetical protein